MEFILNSAPLLFAGVFTLGLLIGSFLNVVILRLPALLEFEWRCQCTELLEVESGSEERPPGIVNSRSKCQNCGHKIPFWENIPVLSYLLLRGKCSSCKDGISLRYPIVELVTALLFTFTIWHFGPSLQGGTALILTAFLIALAGIDIDHQLLPDNLTIPLMWMGILLAINSDHISLVSSVLGATAGYLILWTIYHSFRILTGKEGMGYGDFKLMAALGAWMGWEMLPVIILISSISGAIVGLLLIISGKLNRDKPMPFGPFIAASGWIAFIWGTQILDRYLGVSSF